VPQGPSPALGSLWLIGALAWILLIGLGIRVWFLGVHQTIERDGALYASIAEGLARSGRLIDLRGQYHIHFPPGYPALVAPVYLLVGDSHRAGQIVSLAGGMALVVLAYLLARRMAGAPVGLVAAALVAIYPPLVHAAVSVHSESVYAALFGVALLVSLRLVQRPGLVLSGVAGGLVAAMYLVRPEGLLLSIGFVWVAATWLFRGDRPAAVARRALSFVSCLLAFAVPYIVYLHAITGAWLLSGKDLSVWREASPLRLEGLVLGLARTRPWLGLPTEAAAFAERYLRNLFREEAILAEALSLLVIGFAAVGLVTALNRSTRRAVAEGVLLCGLAPLLLYPVFEVTERYTEPYVLVICVYAARGLVWVARTATRPSRVAALAVALVALVGVRYAPQLAFPLRYESSFELTEYRVAGVWVRDRLGPGVTLMARAPEIAYHARALWIPLPYFEYRDVDAVVEAARRARAAVLVIDERLVRVYRPALLPLLLAAPPEGLTLLYENDDFPKRRVRVFKVSGT
jgi:4-amino-4-deoxy-L-arabinose transferase-like glycosyltransferase